MGYTVRDDQYWPTGQVVPGHSSWRSDRAQAGGGALLEHSIHAVDILCWVFGPVRRVQCLSRNVFGFEVEDVATLLIEHQSGVVGTLLTIFNGVRGREERRVEVFLESGAVELTTDFIVGADEDSLLVQRPDQPAARPDLSRLREPAFLRARDNQKGLSLLYLRLGSGMGPVCRRRSICAAWLRGRKARASGGRRCLPVCGVGWSCGALREAHFLSPAQTSGADSRADPADLVGSYVDRDEASSREAQTQVVRIDRVVYIVLVERS